MLDMPSAGLDLKIVCAAARASSNEASAVPQKRDGEKKLTNWKEELLALDAYDEDRAWLELKEALHYRMCATGVGDQPLQAEIMYHVGVLCSCCAMKPTKRGKLKNRKKLRKK